jgi:hypothetical protein
MPGPQARRLWFTIFFFRPRGLGLKRIAYQAAVYGLFHPLFERKGMSIPRTDTQYRQIRTPESAADSMAISARRPGRFFMASNFYKEDSMSKIKKSLVFGCALFLTALLFITGCTNPNTGIFVPVTDITGVPAGGTEGSEVDLSDATVVPSDADYKTINWSVKDAGTTGLSSEGIVNAKFTPGQSGTLVLTATVPNGKAEGTDYTKDFTITIDAVETYEFNIAGYFKGDSLASYMGSFYDDGIGFSATVFTQYDDGALGISYSGDIVMHIPIGNDGTAGRIIICITDGGSWGKTVGFYYAIAYKNYGYSASTDSINIQTSSAYGAENNGVPTMAQAVTEYTDANGYFSNYGNYRRFKDTVPQTDGTLILTGLEGGWSGADDNGNGDDYFIRIVNPVLTWSSDLGGVASHQFAGTIVETTDATQSSGFIYIKVDYRNTVSGDYEDLVIGNYFAIHWKDKSGGSIKLCAAYGSNKTGTTDLAAAKSIYTTTNSYFNDDYYVVITP